MKDGGLARDLRPGCRGGPGAKFLDGMASGAEALELLLAGVIRRDAKPVARRLFAEFRTIHKILAAPAEDLCRIRGIGPAAAAHLKAVYQITLMDYVDCMKEMPIFDNLQRLFDYLRIRMCGKRVEEARIMFLDPHRRLIEDRVHSVGNIDSVAVRGNEIARRAIELGAKFVIMAHNHPGRRHGFSETDVRATSEIMDALGAVDVMLADHLLVADGAIYSMSDMRLLRRKGDGN